MIIDNRWLSIHRATGQHVLYDEEYQIMVMKVGVRVEYTRGIALLRERGRIVQPTMGCTRGVDQYVSAPVNASRPLIRRN